MLEIKVVTEYPSRPWGTLGTFTHPNGTHQGERHSKSIDNALAQERYYSKSIEFKDYLLFYRKGSNTLAIYILCAKLSHLILS